MRITERCRCGAMFEVTGWGGVAGTRSALEDFRDRHASCLPSHPALSQTGCCGGGPFGGHARNCPTLLQDRP